MHLRQRDGYAKMEGRRGFRPFLLWRLLLNQCCNQLDKLGNHCHQSRSKRDLLGQLLVALFLDLSLCPADVLLQIML